MNRIALHSAVKGIAFLAIFMCWPVLIADEQKTDRVIALVNGEPITAAHLETATKKQVATLNEQMEKLRQSVLYKLIDNLLLEQAARSEGIALSEFLRKNVESVSVSEVDVDDAYEKSREQLAGVLAPEAKYRIRKSMEDNRRADALRRVLDKLRSEARVENRLTDETPLDVARAASEGPALGDPRAPITIVEFSDFECPFCRRAQPIISEALNRWPTQVRRVFKHFPLERHRNAFLVAKAGVCVDQAGRFWEFHNRAFQENQDLSESGVRKIVATLGLDEDRFQNCLASSETSERVRKDVKVGQALRVNGTPTIFVNNKRLSNVAELQAAIKQAMSSTPREFSRN
ncbi:MAG: thioredoxin domain-containing protein [Bryobacteraceae bacterium]|nr:thioredoxin domain-containing protein [Bryobacteraceae bacterium]